MSCLHSISHVEGMTSRLHEEQCDTRSRFLDAMKSCRTRNGIGKARMIHSEILRKELFPDDVYIHNAILSMYTRCGSLDEAQEVFDEIPTRNIVSWNALMTGYVRYGYGAEALHCFECMRDEGLSPNSISFLCALKACGITGSGLFGEEIHNEVKGCGLLEKDIMVGTALVDMYAKCSLLGKAKEVFDELPKRNAISWNALITGFSQHGLGEEALVYFKKMREEGFSPTAITFISLLKACASVRSAAIGEEIHAEIRKQGLLQKYNNLGTALVDMYAKCGMVAKAREAFEELPKRSVISWNALISGYSQQGLGDEALEVFERMKHEQFIPNAVTYVCVLDACSSIGYLMMGEEIHLEMLKKGLLRKEITLGNALVDMYGKCGQVERSQQVFDELPEQDVVSWNSLLDGYAQVGQGQKVLYLFYRLVTKGINPDLVTFLIVLHACNHAGLTEEGALMFDKMNFFYGLMPTSKHYACMVDLFSRAGYFNKAIFCINKTPAASRLQAYLALLAGCRKWVNVELGRWAFERAKEIDPRNLTMYICMAELCAAAGMQGRFYKNLKP